ncbi:hypothetical protein VNI00_018425 [Paramarasmius palmivorus]|uniref:Integrase catalytic domain-containing protein n=1 Tax=Paramarasmius palmivorus TaxID=297713 RepID=A0AAW0AXK4_9AGAR
MYRQLLVCFYGVLLFNIGFASSQVPSETSNTFQISTIRTAYRELGTRVTNTLRVQFGDVPQIQRQFDAAAQLWRSVEQRGHLFDAEELQIISSGIADMMTALQSAIEASADTVDDLPPVPLQQSQTGQRGRPRMDVDPALLEACLQHRGVTGIAPVFGCSARTIRRRAIEYGLAEPCPPVYIQYEDPETGELVRFYKSSTAPMSTLSDDELDTVLGHILQIFPAFGRRMILGHLQHLGHHVPRERVRASYERVTGAPAQLTARPIHRRRYRVAGPNSLWHHDGQHGLIRWRVVIHAFVDGFSRMVTGIQASNNNRAETVLQLFLDAINTHQTPSRVRGDHGVENLDVARYMEENYGVERGSYIWGRSVHNIRIERLWRDVTQGFGTKWYNFFFELEAQHGLSPDVDEHIWLLHHLFLPSVDQDALEWAGAWNSHKLRLDGSRDRSPSDMFLFGVIQQGLRGPNGVRNVDGLMQDDDEHLDDISSYGVDWQDLNNPSLLHHHNEHNPNEYENLDAPHTRQPPHLSLVEVPVFECPFETQEQVDIFQEALEMIPEYYSRDMRDRQSLWVQARALLYSLITPS